MGTTSKLLVTRAELTDSGNYSCIPKNAASSSVVVHVLNGELFSKFHVPSNATGGWEIICREKGVSGIVIKAPRKEGCDALRGVPKRSPTLTFYKYV